LIKKRLLVWTLGQRQPCQLGGKSAAQIWAAAGSSGKISGNTDFLMNMGWMLDWSGQVGKFIKGTR